ASRGRLAPGLQARRDAACVEPANACRLPSRPGIRSLVLGLGQRTNGTLRRAVGLVEETSEPQAGHAELTIDDRLRLGEIVVVKDVIAWGHGPDLLSLLVCFVHPRRRCSTVNAGRRCLAAFQPLALQSCDVRAPGPLQLGDQQVIPDAVK